MADQQPESKIRGVLTFFVCAAFVVLAFIGMKRISEQKAIALREASKKERVVRVRTAKVGRADLRKVLTYNGDVYALRTVDLKPKVSGRLIRLQLEDGTPVEEGVQVQAGQLLAQIDTRDFASQLANAKAACLAAEAACSAAEAALEQKKSSHEAAIAATAAAIVNCEDKRREMQRQENLTAKKASTGQQMDKARTEFEQAEANRQQREADQAAAKAAVASAAAAVDQAKAALAQAKAKEEEAKLNLEETHIYAPMDGVVREKKIDAGSMVSPTTSIVTVMSMNQVKVVFAVPVNQLGQIIPGKSQAVLHPPYEGAAPVRCLINKIYPAVDVATRTAQVELLLENTLQEGQTVLRPGMYATIDVLVEEKKNVIAIDATLPIRNMDKYLVYRLDGNIATAVPVRLGIRSDDLIEVVSGLQEDDEIVVQGQHRLTNGSKIQRVASVLDNSGDGMSPEDKK